MKILEASRGIADTFAQNRGHTPFGPQVLFDIRYIKRGHGRATFPQEIAYGSQRFGSREISDNRHDHIAALQPLYECEAIL